jgi:hypothetical protein
MRVRTAALTLFLSLSVWSCEPSAPRAVEEPPPPSAEPAEPTEIPEPVGSISGVQVASGFVNEIETEAGVSLFPESLVRTDANGVVTFLLEAKSLACNMQSMSEVQVHPEEDVLVLWNMGTTECRTAAGAGEMCGTTVNGTQICASDPVFQVIVEEGQDTVKVFLGFVRVDSLLVKGSAFLGPEQQTTIVSGSPPGALAAIELSELDLASLEALATEYVLPSFERPDESVIEKSEILVRSFDQERIVIAVAGSQEGGETEFAASVLKVLEAAWQIDSVFIEYGSIDAAILALADGEVDILLSPLPPVEYATVPFFETEKGVLWTIGFPEDDSLSLELSQFLRTAIERKNYGQGYFETFGSPPTYDALESILYASFEFQQIEP